MPRDVLVAVGAFLAAAVGLVVLGVLGAETVPLPAFYGPSPVAPTMPPPSSPSSQIPPAAPTATVPRPAP